MSGDSIRGGDIRHVTSDNMVYVSTSSENMSNDTEK